MEERSTNKVKNVRLEEQNLKNQNDIELDEELQDPQATQHQVEWIGRPAVTLIRRWKCPYCGKYDTLNLTNTILTNPLQYQYECSECHKTLITREAITSIVHIDAEYYEKEKKATGTDKVRGTIEFTSHS